MDHIPVLLDEILEYLEPRPDQNFIDATFGLGGHAGAILKKNGQSGKVLGIEVDPELCERAAIQKPDRLILINDSYANLKKIIGNLSFGPVHGILADIGMSSWHLDQSGRGFSFLKDELIDMRYRPRTDADGTRTGADSGHPSAAEIVNTFDEKQLADIFWEYGEEKFSRQIARKIMEARKIKPIVTTFQLLEAIKSATPLWYRRRKTHPATKVFQALRIAVNNELDNLGEFLPQAFEILQKGGRLAIISFHSLEDRIVKNFLRLKNQQGLAMVMTKKAIKPTISEIRRNPRSRSAKLRVAIKL